MRFSSIQALSGLLVESISYDYKVPEDREKQIYDLYLWLTFKQVMDNPKLVEPGLLKPGWDENTLADLKIIIDDGFKEIVTFMTKDYLKAGEVALAAELRHVYDAGQISPEDVRQTLGESDYSAFDRYFQAWKKYMNIRYWKQYDRSRHRKESWVHVGRLKDYSSAYKAYLESGMGLNKLCDIAEKLFPLDGWSEHFAGENWVKIAKEIRKLNNTKNTMDKALQLDRVIDLVHNTGLMVDKSSAFFKKDGYAWIKETLDYKKHATPWQIAQRSSIREDVIGRLFRLTNVSGAKDTDISQKPQWSRHPNGGGMVESSATVAETAFVAKNARVEMHAVVADHVSIYDIAIVSDDAKLSQHAQIGDSVQVRDNAHVSGYAKIYNRAVVYESAYVADKASVRGRAEIYGHAKILDNAVVEDQAWIRGNAQIVENARVSHNAIVGGHAIIAGDAHVSEYAQIMDQAVVRGNAQVKGHAIVKNNAVIDGDMVIDGNMVIEQSPDVK